MLSITAENISRSFAERRVLDRLSFTLNGGERVAVTGPNGSGKTTLLKIVAGLLRPTGGRMQIRDGEDQEVDAWRRRHIGYLAPDLVLYEEFSTLENLEFFGQLRGWGRDPSRDRAILDRVGLGDRGHDPVGTLSTGLRQRAKFAFALQGEPKLLLMDEPGSNLDDRGRALVEGVVQEFASPDRIVVVATNDPAEAAMGTRTLALA